MLASSLALEIAQHSARLGIGINCALAWFNLMPIPPLDGSHVVSGLMPASLAKQYQSLGRHGMIIIIVLLATGVFGHIIVPLIRQTARLIMTVVGI